MATPRFTVPRDDRRECALYRIFVLDPRTNYTTVTLGYIGETGRMPFIRFMEHLYDQPWGDTIVGHPEVDPRVFTSKTEVQKAEEAATLAEKPLYSIEYQKGAQHQIPRWTALEQRTARDAAKGKASPDWAAKGRAPRQLVARPAGHRPARTPAGRVTGWRKARNEALTVAGVWLAIQLPLWLAVAVSVGARIDAPWFAWPISSASVTTASLILGKSREARKNWKWTLLWCTVGALALYALAAGA